MKITQDFGQATYAITSYERGEVRINESRFNRSLIVMPEQLLEDWEPQRFEELTAEHLRAVLQWQPEMVILGTGATQRFPAPEIQRLFVDAGIGMEVMDTAAACRTYNIVMAEGRRVAAALLMIE